MPLNSAGIDSLSRGNGCGAVKEGVGLVAGTGGLAGGLSGEYWLIWGSVDGRCKLESELSGGETFFKTAPVDGGVSAEDDVGDDRVSCASAKL